MATKVDRRDDVGGINFVSKSEGYGMKVKHSFFEIVECSTKKEYNDGVAFEKAVLAVINQR